MGQYYRGVILEKDFRTSFKDEKAEVKLSPYDYKVGAKLMEHSFIGNPYPETYMTLLGGVFYGYPFVWCGDYADDIREYLYGKDCESDGEKCIPYDFDAKITGIEVENTHYHYLISLSKKQFVDMYKIKDSDDDWGIHPLPLLCCNSNGRGCGDYKGTDMDKVGAWAYDNIGAGNVVPEGFTELITNFKET